MISRTPGLLTLERQFQMGLVSPLEYGRRKRTAGKKNDSEADDSKSKECTRADGTTYRIAKKRNGKETVCGGAKTSKKSIKSPKGKAAADAVKQKAAAKQKAGSFEGAIGGLKRGKKYQVNADMLEAAQKLGVSQRALQAGRVPKAVQEQLIKEFDRLSDKPGKGKGKPDEGGVTAGLAVRPGAMTREKEQQAKDAEEKQSRKTPRQRIDQFERMAFKISEQLIWDKDSLEMNLNSPRRTGKEERERAESELSGAQAHLERLNKLTPKEYLKEAEADLKKLRAEMRAEKDPHAKRIMKDFVASEKRQVDKIKADPERVLNANRKGAEFWVERHTKKLDSTDFEAEARESNRRLAEIRKDLEASIGKATRRMERIWSSVQTLDSPVLQDAMSQLGVKPSGNMDDDMKAAKSSFRKRAMETHPDRGGNPDEFQSVSKAWDTVRAAHVAGGGPPLVNPGVQSMMRSAGFDMDFGITFGF